MNCAVIMSTGTVSGGSGGAPTAIFHLAFVAGHIGMENAFADQSTGNPTSWLWTVNGANYSNLQDAYYYCGSTGSFTVQLTATNQFGSNTSGPQTFVIS